MFRKISLNKFKALEYWFLKINNYFDNDFQVFGFYSTNTCFSVLNEYHSSTESTKQFKFKTV